jgi:hypothetical protein
VGDTSHLTSFSIDGECTSDAHYPSEQSDRRRVTAVTHEVKGACSLECWKGRSANFALLGFSEDPHSPGQRPMRFTNPDCEASCALAKHLWSLRLIRRLPATSLFRPPQLAHCSPHRGDGNPVPLLALPQFAVALQGGSVVLFELSPQSAALLDGGAERCTSGGPWGTYLSGLPS